MLLVILVLTLCNTVALALIARCVLRTSEPILARPTATLNDGETPTFATHPCHTLLLRDPDGNVRHEINTHCIEPPKTYSYFGKHYKRTTWKDGDSVIYREVRK